MSTGDKFKAVRKAKGLTMVEVAKLLKIKSQSHISTIERGESIPSGTLVEHFKQTFNVNEHWWETGEGEMFKPHIPSIAEPIITSADHLKAMVFEYFKKAGVNPAPAEKVLEELGKLDEGNQFAEVGKIINDAADIRRKKGRGHSLAGYLCC